MRILWNSLALLSVLAVGLVGSTAQAQTDVNCPQRLIDKLEQQFPGEGRGTAPGDCQAWKHGIAESTNQNFARGGGDPRCNAPNNITSIFGQLIFIEPKDSVCNPFDAGVASCPFVSGGDGPSDDGANRSYWESPALIQIPGVFRFLSAQVISVEDGIGYRIDCGKGNGVADFAPPGSLFDRAECDTGQTAIFFDDGFTSGDPAVPCADGGSCSLSLAVCEGGSNPGDACDPEADWHHFQNRLGDSDTEGNAVCCESPSGVFCANAANFDEYPILTRPLPDAVPNRPETPPLVFEGGRGSAFRHGESYQVAGQVFGYCTINQDIECNRSTDPDFGPNDPCPSIGDTCDYRENGIRAGTRDFTADGSPNPFRCQGAEVIWRGAAVDPVTGRSTGCALGEFFPAGTEGDPQPGCQVQNFGSYTLPDLDCDGVRDDTDGDGQPGPDLCPAIAEMNPFDDSNGDGIGDDCQCGDGNDDGAVTGLDIAATALCANAVNPCDFTKVDADGDISTTSLDIAGVVAAVNGNLTNAELLCLRKP